MSATATQPSAADTKRYADLQSWISAGHQNGKPLNEEDYHRLEDERDGLVQKHGPAIRRRATATQGGPRESYTPPAGAGPRKHSSSSSARSQNRGSRSHPSAGGRSASSTKPKASPPRRKAGSGARGGSRRQPTTNVTIVDQAASAATQAASTGYTIATGTTAGGMVVDFMIGGVGLCVLYLLLTKSKSVSGLISGVTNTITAVVSPTVDPLNPTRKA